MFDMLVRLYDLPDEKPLVKNLAESDVVIRRANAFEKHIVTRWVGQHFSPKWVSETEVAFSRQPISCFIATKNKEILGFACCECTCRAFFGPMGVEETCRQQGVGKALLLVAMQHLAHLGYAYGIVGGVGPAEFYKKCVGAMPIEGSTPGIYQDILPD